MLLFLVFFAASSLPVSAQSIYRAIAVDAVNGDTAITVQPGDTFTVRFGLSYEGVETGTTEDTANQLRFFGIDARVFTGDTTIGTSVPPSVITTLDVTSIARGANAPDAAIEIEISSHNAAISAFNDGFIPSARVDCNTNGCALEDLLQVTYQVAADASPSAFKIGNIADFSGRTDDQGGVPTIRRDELRVFVVQPQILAELWLNHGAAGGTLSLTGIIPSAGFTIPEVVSSIGTTCLELSPATCTVDTTFITSVTTVSITFPASPACEGNTCTSISTAGAPSGLPLATDDFTNGRASLEFTGVQYDLNLPTETGDATFRISAADAMINGVETPIRVFIGVDQTNDFIMPDGVNADDLIFVLRHLLLCSDGPDSCDMAEIERGLSPRNTFPVPESLDIPSVTGAEGGDARDIFILLLYLAGIQDGQLLFPGLSDREQEERLNNVRRLLE